MAETTSGSAQTRATITIDGDGWFQAVSPTMLQLIDRPIEELSGLNIVDLVHPRDAPATRKLLAALDMDTNEVQGEFRLFCAGDMWQLAQVVARAVGDGRIVLDVLVDASAGEGTSSSSANAPASMTSALTTSVASAAAAAESKAADNDAAQSDAADVADVSAGLTSSTDVPDLRAAVRESLGGATTAMVEIDSDGTTHFVSGPWHDLTDNEHVDERNTDVLRTVLAETEQAHEVERAITQVLSSGQSTTVALTGDSHADRHVHVRPIPSPFAVGVVNALVAISAESTLSAVAVPAPTVDDTAVVGVSAAEQRTTSTTSQPAAVATMVAAEATTPEATTPEVTTPEATTPDAVGGGDASNALPKPARELPVLESLRAWLNERGMSTGQLGALVGLLFVSLLLRTWDLSSLPGGLHGDEAITGLEAQRVLADGSIGVYTPSALGQPTAPFYLHALAVGLFGPTIWATRIISALAGVITIGVLYVVLQKRFDHRIAFASAAVMALMNWSIHFSRIAFGLAWWPLVIIMSIAAIDRATRDITWRNWAIAGAWSAFGIYVYNSHAAFGLAVIIFMLAWLTRQVIEAKKVDVERLLPILGGLGGALLVGLPMISYARGDNGYSNHFNLVRRTSVELTPEWAVWGTGEKIRRIIGWYIDTWDQLIFAPGTDGVDASGVVTQVPPIVILLAVVGLVETLRRHRTAFMGMALVVIVVMPLIPAITVNGNTRRAYAMAPCLAILAGIGAVALYSLVANKANVTSARYVAIGLAVVMVFSNVLPYFTTFRNNPTQQWVFVTELTATVDAVDIASEDRPVYVNFFSGRHDYRYETLQFLLQDTPGASRTPLDQGFQADPNLELTQDVELDQLYVFIGDYANNLDRLRSMYPDGTVVLDQPAPRVVAYEVPAR